MFSSLLALPLLYGASVAAQSVSVVCVAGQCLEGFTNTTLGATLSASGSSTSLHLLPGQYTSDTNPEALHELLTSSSASLVASPGFFVNKSISLPLDLALSPGIALYPKANYSGQATFAALPNNASATNSSKQLSAGSFGLASNMWAAMSGTTSNDRVIFWDSVPDISQLPSSTLSDPLTLLEMQSSACSPACAGAGICSSSGKCICPTGFTGTSCQSCAEDFFGPTCSPCPSDCKECDDGLQGTGKCLVVEVSDPPASCNCINGVCGTNGTCSCNAGWTTASNGTACAKCSAGFFLDSSGDCEVCALGCSECADGTGDCITCKTGFTQSSSDATACTAISSTTTTSSGTTCPDGSFSNGTTCTQCSTLCETCTGATSNDCIICAQGTYSLNGSCVSTNDNGVCENTVLIANNNKHECDSCPAKCTKCEYSSFSVASTINEAKCTGCVPGYVLSDGECVESCPSGTFLSPTDNLTCTACDSSCSTCVEESTFCLTCADNKLASNGTCVSSCPSNTFSSSGSCLACHPDCATCSGGSFDQCSSCNSDLPVLTNGRCLPTCSQNQYFDTTSSTCQSCDSSCSSCSGPDSSNCLACSSSSQLLRGGTCVNADCGGSSSVVSGLGLCLSDLVQTVAVTPSGTTTVSSLPSITGISTSTTSSTTHSTLAWWQILLMALGCAFIFLVVVVTWRKRMRRKRAQATKAFALAKNLDSPPSWRMRLVRFGERLFGHTPRQRWVVQEGAQDMKLEPLTSARFDRDMEKLGGDDYQDFRPKRSPLPTLREYAAPQSWGASRPSRPPSVTSLSADSFYTQITGQPRRAPDPRQPVRSNPRDLLPSRFSDTTYATEEDVLAPTQAPTPAQEYARSVQAQDSPRSSYWLQPNHTGSSRNPFRH
ncbi:growth factor receptor domain-containing protein [Wolfiporia cocos MD-104 SS10]|uniref:Growth factor receptor domain-containing protein n=1 Tax=Wolfiporia cocos (strain MD-104) TaxID=742152 RepID=A0A2H3JPK4_WOLCO|nr:growth factor receptor domain-containing protein [Wolfiporia cocos MD-104 SS10]